MTRLRVIGDKSRLHSLTTLEGFCAHSQYEHPKHPPDKEYRYDGPRDMNYPVAGCFRFPKIEHAAIVAGPAQDGIISPENSSTEDWPILKECRSSVFR